MTDDTQVMVTGRCLCKATQFRLQGPHNWVGHCYCESCRRATASPMTTFIGHENGKWTLSGAEPATFQSSPAVTRGFCATCGTPLFYKSDQCPDETHFYAANLDEPEAVQPTTRYHTEEAISWLK